MKSCKQEMGQPGNLKGNTKGNQSNVALCNPQNSWQQNGIKAVLKKNISNVHVFEDFKVTLDKAIK